MDPGMVTSIIVKEFLKNKNNVINNQIIVIFYTPFTNQIIVIFYTPFTICQSWIEILKCNIVCSILRSNSQSF